LLQVPPSTDIVVGIDTHKHIHAAVALSALGARLGATTVPASRAPDTAASQPGRAPSAR
jgi:hypothetical protein